MASAVRTASELGAFAMGWHAAVSQLSDYYGGKPKGESLPVSFEDVASDFLGTYVGELAADIAVWKEKPSE